MYYFTGYVLICIFFTMLLCIWLYRAKSNTCIVIWSEYRRFCLQFWDFCYNKPTIFCVLCSGCLCALGVCGYVVYGSTALLVVLVMAVLLSTKSNLKCIQLNAIDFKCSAHENTDFDNNFSLEENEGNMFVLQRACDESTLSLVMNDREAEERRSDVSTELTSSDISFAEVIDEVLSRNYTIKYKRRNFKHDALLDPQSSSSEDELSKGLKFPDFKSFDQTSSRGATPFTKSVKLLSSLFSGTLSQAHSSVTANSVTRKPSKLTQTVIDVSTTVERKIARVIAKVDDGSLSSKVKCRHRFSQMKMNSKLVHKKLCESFKLN